MNPEIPAAGIVEHLTDEEREILSSYGEFVPVQDEQFLIEAGSPQDSLFLLCTGALSIHASSGGRKIVLGEVEPGGCVGEISMFDPEPEASASVTGKGFSQVWRINRPELEVFIGENPTAAAKLLIGIAHVLSSRLRNANETLTGAKDAVPRLVEALKEAKDVITRAQDELPGMISMR